jgi:hypothetical protein
MNLNFFKPKELIKSGYDKPNLGLSVLLVLLPFFFIFLIGLFYGFPIDLMTMGLSIINYLLFWFIGGILLFILIYILKGKKAEFNLKGILFNLSLINFISALMFVISFIGLILMNPSIFSELSHIVNTTVTAETTIEMLSEITFISSEISLIVFILIALIGLILTFYAFYLLYLIISVTKKEWIAKNIIILLIYMAFYALIGFLISF